MASRLPVPATEPPVEFAAGVLGEQQRQAVVLATVQIDIGDQKVSMAVMQHDVTDIASEIASLKRIIQGDDGERSMVMRLGVVERSQKSADDKMTALLEAQASAAKEARADTRQLLLALISVFVSVLVAAGTVIVTLLRK